MPAFIGLPELLQKRRRQIIRSPVHLLHKLQAHDWNVTQTAQSVQTPRSNLYKKLDYYEIKREE